jgi:hypothetical protein
MVPNRYDFPDDGEPKTEKGSMGRSASMRGTLRWHFGQAVSEQTSPPASIASPSKVKYDGENRRI